VYVGAYCPCDFSDSDGIIKCKFLPSNKLYHPVLQLVSKVIFPSVVLVLPPRNKSIVHTLVRKYVYFVHDARKSVDIGFGLVHVFEFWENEVTCFHKDTNSGGVYAEYVNAFLKLKQESSGYPFWVQCGEEKYRYIEDYRRADGIALDKPLSSKNSGQQTLAKQN